MKWAIRAAELSSASEHRVGAALYRGSRLISIGWNSIKTHPASLTRYNGHHAEFACLLGLSKEQILGTTIFVARLTKASRLGISLPCSVCHPMLKAAGVKVIFALNRDNEVVKIKL